MAPANAPAKAPATAISNSTAVSKDNFVIQESFPSVSGPLEPEKVSCYNHLGSQ